MSAGKGGPSNPIGGPAPMPGQPSPGMPAQDPYNRPEATNLPRYAGQPGYPGTGPYTPRPDLGPDVGFGPGLPTPMPMPGMPGGKSRPIGEAGFSNLYIDENGNLAGYSSNPYDKMMIGKPVFGVPQQQPGMQSPTGFAQPGVPFGPAGSPVTNQPVANQYTRTRTNPGNRFIPSNAPGR